MSDCVYTYRLHFFSEKRKWSDVQYGDCYCRCNCDECGICDKNEYAEHMSCLAGGKKSFVSAMGLSAASSMRCRASGALSAPPVPARLSVLGMSSTTGGGCGAGCSGEPISRSGSSGCSSQQSCCGDDEDAYMVSIFSTTSRIRVRWIFKYEANGFILPQTFKCIFLGK